MLIRHHRETSVAPDRALGALAFNNALEGVLPLGPVGAGRAATVGKMGVLANDAQVVPEGGGQGAACARVKVREGLEVGLFVCTVVNAIGGIVDRRGTAVRGHRDVATGDRLRAAEVLRRTVGSAPCPRGNTTLSLVVMDHWVPDFHARQAARQIHTSMARALDPFHTESDGDVLFFVRYARPLIADEADWSPATRAVGVVGAELMWDSILSCWQS